MRIHENPTVEQLAIETIASLQLGMEEETLSAIISVYEEEERYEECLGIQLGIEYYNTGNFNCKIKKPEWHA